MLWRRRVAAAGMVAGGADGVLPAREPYAYHPPPPTLVRPRALSETRHRRPDPRRRLLALHVRRQRPERITHPATRYGGRIPARRERSGHRYADDRRVG